MQPLSLLMKPQFMEFHHLNLAHDVGSMNISFAAVATSCLRALH